MEDDAERPLIVLMHGDREVSTEDARARDRREDDRAVRARRRRSSLGLPGRRHEPVRHAPRDARLHASARSPTLPRVYVNGGTARLPRRHGARRPRARAGADAGRHRDRRAGMNAPEPRVPRVLPAAPGRRGDPRGVPRRRAHRRSARSPRRRRSTPPLAAQIARAGARAGSKACARSSQGRRRRRVVPARSTTCRRRKACC